MTSLNYLNVASNKLSGTIPSSLCTQVSRSTGGSFYLTTTGNPNLECYPACLAPQVYSSSYFSKDATLARTCGSDRVTEMTQMQVLQDLYTKTGGSTWTYAGNARNWVFTKLANGFYANDPCATSSGSAWSGVTCTLINSQWVITGLSLASYGLVGSLPSSLGGLTNLVSLLLNNNKLTGTVPCALV